MAGVDIGLLVLNSEINWYVGLSGILHGLFAAGAILYFRRFGVQGAIYLVLLLGKLLWEQLSGPLPGTTELTGVRVIIDAHLYGAIGGLIVTLLWYARIHSIARRYY
jgi:rhomboid family GlyGly-CTERM serine protease